MLIYTMPILYIIFIFSTQNKNILAKCISKEKCKKNLNFREN